MEGVASTGVQKKKGVNYRELAKVGESPIKCKDCRWNGSKQYRGVGFIKVCRKRLFNETAEYAVERKERRKVKGEERVETVKVYKNTGRGHPLDQEYSCWYGLPPVVRRPEKPAVQENQIDPVSADDLNEHWKATGQIPSGEADEQHEAREATAEAAPEQQDGELQVRETGSADDDDGGFIDASGVKHYR
jgi:hypothetical protein